MSAVLKHNTKVQLNVLNEQIRDLLNSFNAFRDSKNYASVVNGTFFYLQNHAHDSIEPIFKQNSSIVQYCIQTFTSTFFQDCLSSACKNVLSKIDTQLLSLIFDFCKNYENHVSREFKQFKSDDAWRLKVFVCCCSSILLFCAIKMDYMTPSFDYIDSGSQFDNNRQTSVNYPDNKETQVVWINYDPGMRDIYSNTIFQKSKVITNVIQSPNQKLQTNQNIHKTIESPKNKTIRFKIVEAPKNHSNPLFNEVLMLLDNFTLRFHHFCNTFEIPQLDDQELLQDLTIRFVSRIHEIRNVSFDIDDFVRNNFSDGLIIDCEQKRQINFKDTKNGKIELAIFNEICGSMIKKHIGKSFKMNDTMKILFQQIVLYALFIFKKRSIMNHNHNTHLSWIENSMYFQPHLQCANNRILRPIKGTLKVGAIDTFSNVVTRKSTVVIDQKERVEKESNCLVDDMNLPFSDAYEKKPHLKKIHNESIQNVFHSLDNLYFCFIDLKKSMELNFDKQLVQRVIFSLNPVLSSRMEHTLQNMGLDRFDCRVIFDYLKQFVEDFPGDYFAKVEASTVPGLASTFKKLNSHVCNIIGSILGKHFLTDKTRENIKSLCACSLVLYHMVKKSQSQIKLICNIEGDVYDSRYNMVDDSNHYDQMVGRTIYFGLYEPSNGQILLKSKVELK